MTHAEPRTDAAGHGTSWDHLGNIRNTHTTAVAQRWCMSTCPHPCGCITPSRSPGFRPPEPRTPHVQHAPASRHDGSQPTRTHERTRASCIWICTDRQTRTARPKRPPHHARHAQIMLLACNRRPLRSRAPATRHASEPLIDPPEKRVGFGGRRPRAPPHRPHH